MKILLLIVMFPAALCYSQENDDVSRAKLEWNEFYKLGWEDFEGTPDEHSKGDAATSVQIKATPYYVKNKVRYDVYVYFNRDQSWARGKSNTLLKHEQLHFDIAELYARKIRKKITELTRRGVNDVSVFNKAINILLEESNEVDRRYDMETLHGALHKKQLLWESRVKEQLIGLKDYKKKKRVITIGKDLRMNGMIYC